MTSAMSSLSGFDMATLRKELLQVIWEVRTASIAGVHGNEDTGIGIDAQLSTNEFNLRLVILGTLLEANLDVLNLLRDGRQDPLLETKLNSSKQPQAPTWQIPRKIRPIGLEVERVITAEHEGESTELHAERLDGLRLTSSGGSIWRATETLAQALV